MAHGSDRFVMIPESVIRLIPEVGGGALAVYVVLADFADVDGRCWPSISRIAKATGMAKQSVRNYIQKLKLHDVISIKKQKAGDASLPNTYRIQAPYLCSKKIRPLVKETTEKGSQKIRPGVKKTEGGWSKKREGGGLKNDTLTRTIEQEKRR